MVCPAAEMIGGRILRDDDSSVDDAQGRDRAARNAIVNEAGVCGSDGFVAVDGAQHIDRDTAMCDDDHALACVLLDVDEGGDEPLAASLAESPIIGR